MTGRKIYYIINMYNKKQQRGSTLLKNIFTNKIKIPTLKRLPSLILKIGLPIMTLVFTYILLFILNTPQNERAWIIYTGYTMLESAVMSFTLIFCGALFVDMVIKEE